jgi:creatinine amidohydrolase/Fe(II)-dependent formamide hydrolase-like protein
MRTAILLAAAFALAFQSASPWPGDPDPAAERPIDAADTVFMEDMTWMEVRDALALKKTTAIVAAGGLEQSGPYLVTGKHNVILRATTQKIARVLGDALVAPIVPFVPHGDIEPPSGPMRYPGTISVREDTYRRLLIDVCGSLRAHGFKDIVLLGDSRGSQEGLKQVAQLLNQQWAGGTTRVHYIAQYYDPAALDQWVADHGIEEVPEGLHDSFAVTAMMMSVDPNSVRMQQRGVAGKFSINGIDLAPAPKTIELGRDLVAFRAQATARAIKQRIDEPPSGE